MKPERFALRPDPRVLDRRGRIRPHAFEEAHDSPVPAPICWACLRGREAKVHRPKQIP
jgi:hypothetical protein